MDSSAFILRVSIAYFCLLILVSTIFPLSGAVKLELEPQNSLNKFSSFEYLDTDSYGSPSSQPLPPFNSLAPQPYSSLPNPPPSPKTIITISPPPTPPPSPPKHVPSPPKTVTSPPKAYPPPPPPSLHKNSPPHYAIWCVAKPTVPDPIIQFAMDYACGSGADCKSIQPNGPCFQPNTLLAHASFAFNSYWQNTKIGGGTCDFGGTAMLVNVDPSYDKCNFMST
ncbi:major pollen allergen Ole e 10-like isoform X2 [Vicia villosa]|uniref:major pollen allergen Ole e 10-like isoform X2 n=1 Tax=Vicia villosa TaxID=3911 RepID=UPI00273C6510|nr:major pollen allergen Ole e 10-like isoform X2 [Vicia villosa]